MDKHRDDGGVEGESRLKQGHGQKAERRTHGKGNDRLHFHHDEDHGHGGEQHQPGVDDEGGREHADHGAAVGVGRGVVVKEAFNEEDGQRQDHRGAGGEHHVTDMGEEVDPATARGNHRSVAQGRDLVAEVCAGNDGAGYPGGAEAENLADAHEGDANGGDSGPGASGEDGYAGAHEADSGKEERGIHHLETVTDEGGDYAAGHPCGGKQGDEDQDRYGRENLRGASAHSLREAPFHAGEPPPYEQQRECRGKEKHIGAPFAYGRGAHEDYHEDKSDQ